MGLKPRLLAAIALAGLMGAAQVAPLLHLVLVPHMTCAAHGELVHGEVSAAPSAPVDGDIAFTAAASAQQDEHEHCLTLSAQRPAVLRSSTRVAVDAPREQCTSGSELPAFASLAVLELAPKASPPV
jgi:hypothetical protein